jgi:hypothetical protein
MGGVGSINDPSRTLYVGGLALSLKKTEGWSAKAAVYTAFAEFGEVENINVIDRLSIAFVRYRYRSSTEFAREAMTNQSLGNGEMLNTRWAHDDPNPKAMLASERANLQMVVERVIAVDRSRSSQREDQEQAAAAGAAAAAAAAASSAGGAAALGGVPLVDLVVRQPIVVVVVVVVGALAHVAELRFEQLGQPLINLRQCTHSGLFLFRWTYIYCIFL